MFYEFFSIYIKFFFLLTPFFAVTVFLVLTKDMGSTQRHINAIKATFAVVVITLTLYYLGNSIFHVFGITIDAFRVGSGCVLFLTSIELVSGRKALSQVDTQKDISVVPMALPLVVGPGTIGTLLVWGASNHKTINDIINCIALICAGISVGILLYISDYVERIIGKTGLEVLSKISGLVISALAAQIIFTGVKNFLEL